MRLEPGSAAIPFRVTTLDGATISLDSFAKKPLLLMFFRYASCPMCNLRLLDLSRELPRLRAEGLEAVAFFHSSERRVRAAAGARKYPLHVVADPTRAIYRAYGTEVSWLPLLLSTVRLRFYWDWMRAMRHGFWGGLDLQLGQMPADFLIGPDGRVRHAHYGRDIGDHLPIEAIEAFVHSMVRRGAP